MGPDGGKRRVLKLVSGEEEMFKIIPNKGRPYVVNKPHILTLVSSSTAYGLVKGEIYDIPLMEYLAMPSCKQKNLMTIRTGIELPPKAIDYDPYIYGVWLGDGHRHGPSITNGDKEVCESWTEYANKVGLEWTEYPVKENARRLNYVTRGRVVNPFLDFIRSSLNVDGNKYIKEEYLHNSRSIRLEVLAGLLDTDGYLMPHRKGFEITQKSKPLARDILYLARSLGFMATKTIKTVKGKDYVRIYIYGNLSAIPTRVPRKKGRDASKFKNYLAHGFTVEPLGPGKYYGFTLEGDRHFLLGDFQVTHNTEFIKDIIANHVEQKGKVGIFSLEQAAEDTARRLAASYLNKPIYIPDSPHWNAEDIKKVLDKLEDNVVLYDLESGELSLEKLVINLKLLKNAYKVDLVVIDNLTALCTNPYLDGKRTTPIKYAGEVMAKISELAKQLKMHIIVAAHTNKSSIQVKRTMGSSAKAAETIMDRTAEEMNKLINPAGSTWETGRMPSIDNVLGAGTTAQLSDHVIALARNKEAESDLERRTTNVKFIKTGRKNPNRNKNGFKLLYNYDVGKLEEI